MLAEYLRCHFLEWSLQTCFLTYPLYGKADSFGFMCFHTFELEILLPHQWSWSQWNFVCGSQYTEKLDLSFNTKVPFQKQRLGHRLCKPEMFHMQVFGGFFNLSVSQICHLCQFYVYCTHNFIQYSCLNQSYKLRTYRPWEVLLCTAELWLNVDVFLFAGLQNVLFCSSEVMNVGSVGTLS